MKRLFTNERSRRQATCARTLSNDSQKPATRFGAASCRNERSRRQATCARMLSNGRRSQHHWGVETKHHCNFYTTIKTKREARKLTMRNPEIEKKMYELAVELIEKRYPTGWGGAAVIHTNKGHYFTSVARSDRLANASAELCIEVGAMCEAHKYNEKVTHCLCVTREDEKFPLHRSFPLRHLPGAATLLGRGCSGGRHHRRRRAALCRISGSLQPYHWSNAYPAEELDRYVETDESLHS